MAAEGLGHTIGPMVMLMATAVVAIPLFRQLGLGSVLGYFAAGMLVGPSGIGLFKDPASILHFSELGVVMFLFVIGLELRPQKLWTMRGQIFGLGLAQVVACIVLLTIAGMLLFGLAAGPAFVAGSGFVMSSTAVIMSMLQERGEIASAEGQKAVSILLFEDLMIVPLLAAIAFLAPGTGGGGGLAGASVAVAAVGALLVIGRYLLDPFFSLLARARNREVLTAGALLVVLGAALLMEAVGLSMAMGTFVAGVMLSSSSYRHQIESDIEPFRGLLMGLFFLAVGMSLNIPVVAAEWRLLLSMLGAYVILKAIGIYAVARLFGSSNSAAVNRASMFAQGGEFAFVLYSAANGNGLIDARQNALFSTVVILSMALTPLVLLVMAKLRRDEPKSLDGVEHARDLKGRALIIGFGRVGQVASQMLLARGVDVSIIENDPDRIREAARFGFRIHYGDGRRLDILSTSGARDAEVVLVCVDGKEQATQIAKLIDEEFPLTQVIVRAYDRTHAIDLIRAGINDVIRETFESAMLMGKEALRGLGCSEERIDEAAARVRRLDQERLIAQVQGDLYAGKDAIRALPVPEPLTGPNAARMTERKT